MKKFLAKLTPILLVAALAFGNSLAADQGTDREPTTVEFLEGKVYRLSVELEEVRFQLKDKSIAKLEKKTLKLKKRQLKRELRYNKELLAHARYPARYAHPGPWRYYNYGPFYTGPRRVYCPPSYRRPVVIINQNQRRRDRGRDAQQRTQPRRSQATPRPHRSSSSSFTPGKRQVVKKSQVQTPRKTRPINNLKPIKP